MRRKHRVQLHRLAPALRAALSLLLVASLSALCLHTHTHTPSPHTHDHHAHDHDHEGDHAPHGDHSEAPCVSCVLLAGLALPLVPLHHSSPPCVSTQVRVPVDAAPRSILSWSSRLLRAPPQFA